MFDTTVVKSKNNVRPRASVRQSLNRYSLDSATANAAAAARHLFVNATVALGVLFFFLFCIYNTTQDRLGLLVRIFFKYVETDDFVVFNVFVH